jgi:succinyl-CoA synthetase beta subunit
MARLYEYQGKSLLSRSNFKIPTGKLITNPKEAAEFTRGLGKKIVIKPQILSGRRGKAGLIKFADSEDEVLRFTEHLFSTKIEGIPIQSILLEEKIEVKRECYASVSGNPLTQKPTIMFCAEGGIDIEVLADSFSEKIITKDIDILKPLYKFETIDMVRKAGLGSNAEIMAISDALLKLYEIYRKYDCKLVEINPLAISSVGILALDARIDLDDDAIFRHPELNLEIHEETGNRPPTKLELAASKIDYADHRGSAHFVQLDPDGSRSQAFGKIPIGVDCVGGASSLILMDELIEKGYYPVDFCDTSGNPIASKLYRITKIIFAQSHIKGYIFAICGPSAQQNDNVVRGIIKALKELFPQTNGCPKIPALFVLGGAHGTDALNVLKEHQMDRCPSVRIVGDSDSLISQKRAAELFDELYNLWIEGRM